MQFMTFNLRFDNDADRENSWDRRRRQVIDLIERYAPSVLGTQEGTPRQLRYLRENLCGYAMHTPPERVWDETCQYTTLFYRCGELRVSEGGECWLSKNPTVHRSKDWDSAYPRMMSYALCEPVGPGAGPLFWAVVTHLDNLGTEARVRQAGLISEWLGKRRQAPVVLMGDFNDAPGSTVHRLLTSPEFGLRDSWEVLGLGEGRESMTHHGFVGVPDICRLDWILLSGHFHVLDARIIRDHNEGRYPSDHFPYLVSCTVDCARGGGATQ
jgi:endonuclease/exonuclease/phosphatase family metal-dependent hydrolase